MTASSSENRRWRRAIKGLAKYCDAQALLRVTWSDIKSSSKESARKKHKIFSRKLFFFTTVSYQLLTRAPLLFGAYRGVSIFRCISPQNLRWSHRVSKLRLLLWRWIRHILSNMRRGSWQNMARLYLWIYNHNPHRRFWKCFYPGVTGLYSAMKICGP